MNVVVAKGGMIQTGHEPKPQPKLNHVLIRTVCSAISPGTELMIARRPNEQAVPLGYSAAGYVVNADPDCGGLTEGQRVACYGGPYVRHAEWLSVPRNLVVPIPDSVSFQEASFVGLGAIAIHALRKASLQFGETIVVVGLGIIGQLVSQIAHTAAYRVIAYDVLTERRNQLKKLIPDCTVVDSIEELCSSVPLESKGSGVDAVLLCANASDGSLIDQALRWVKERGQVVVVGDMKMDFNRGLMFLKEANITVSKAGGPGRGDPTYERDGHDYPINFVRWTEGRNMEEYMRLLERKLIHVGPLISGQVSFEQVLDVYERYKTRPEHTLGMVIRYDT